MASTLGVQQLLDMRKARMLVVEPGGQVEMRVTLPSNLSSPKNFMRELRRRYDLADDFRFNGVRLHRSMFAKYKRINRYRASPSLKRETVECVPMSCYS